MILNTRTQAISVFLAVALGLSGCQGGSSGGSATPTPTPAPAPTPPPSPAPNPTPAAYTIGGNVSGLAQGAQVVLLNNGQDKLTVQTNGTFAFPASLENGSAYSVTIGQQPAGQTCSVSHASGSVSTENINNIAVSCINNTPPAPNPVPNPAPNPTPTPTSSAFSISGALTGLATSKTITLKNNGSDSVILNADGRFSFPTKINQGSAYAVTVGTQPTGQTCTVANGSGTVGTSDVTNVSVSCTTNTYTLGGGVSGLHSGQTLVIQNNGGDTLTLNTAGGFIFPTPLAEGAAYAVTITQQPAFETCAIANGSGTMGSSNITTVSIGCTVNQYLLGGTLSGLITGQETVGLTNTIGSMPPLGLINNGSFNFYGLIAQGTAYNVIVSHQPAGQTCTVSNGSGTVGAGDVTSIGVACVTSGTVTTFAGSRSGAAGQSDGQGTTASFSSPKGIAADANGNLYVADTQNDTIRKITPSGYVSTFAGTVGVPAYADGFGPGYAGSTGMAAMFNRPSGVATDAQGNVYVADTFNNMIRKITPAGMVTTMAGSTTSGQQDGIGSDAGFTAPQGIAVDSSGNVFVADTSNNCIREITPSGAVTTIAGVCGTPGGYTDGPAATARFYAPTGIAVGPNGLLYIADFSNQVIRILNTTTQTVSTLAGSGTSGYADGNGTAAQFSFPFGLTVGPAGDIYVADNNNYRIRKITPAGVVTTLAGSGTTGSLDGVGTAAQFRGPAGITYNPVTGTLFVVDVNNSNIRQVTR